MKVRGLSIFAILALTLTFFIPTKVFAAPTFDRYWGYNRYGTSTSISKNGWTSPVDNDHRYAVIAYGEDFPDALSAAPLAKKYNAPILLVSSNLDTPDNDHKDTVLTSELNRLKITDVFIVGGTGVVSPAIEKKLKDMKINCIRLSGPNRYATSIEIAKQVGSSNGVVITTGYSFTDALSVSSVAAKMGMPIILVPERAFDSSTSAITNFIKSNSIPKTYVIGGTDLISNDIANAFPSPSRITGSTAYERNANIIENFKTQLDFSTIFVASGKEFADGLSCSPLAALKSSPIVLTGDTVDKSTNTLLSKYGAQVQNVVVSGGEGAVKQSTVANIIKLTDTNGFQVISIE